MCGSSGSSVGVGCSVWVEEVCGCSSSVSGCGGGSVDRKSVVEGKSVDLGDCRSITKRDDTLIDVAY